MKLSLCVIAKDEEAWLEQCLASVKDVVDEIIVVNNNSNDKTAEIARQFGAKVIPSPIADDFSALRNESLKHAHSTWVLVLDADECIAAQDIEKLRELLSTVTYDAFSLPIRTYFTKAPSTIIPGFIATTPSDSYRQYAKGDGYVLAPSIRLFRNKIGITFSGKIYENVEKSVKEVFARVGTTDMTIHHYANFREQSQQESRRAFFREMAKKSLAAGEDVRSFFLLGNTHMEEADYPAAINAYTKANQLEPANVEITTSLGIAYYKSGNDRRALRCFTTALRIPPKNARTFSNKQPYATLFSSIGVLMEKQQRYAKAIVAYEKAIKLGHQEKAMLQQRVDQMKKLLEEKPSFQYSMSLGTN